MFEIFLENNIQELISLNISNIWSPDVGSGIKELEISPKFLDQFLISSPLIF